MRVCLFVLVFVSLLEGLGIAITPAVWNDGERERERGVCGKVLLTKEHRSAETSTWMRWAETYCPINKRIWASQPAERSRKGKNEGQREQKQGGVESDPQPILPLLLLTLNSPPSPHQNTSHLVTPSHPSVSLSLLCSRLQRSQLLRGLQCYAIAQAESWRGRGVEEEWMDRGWERTWRGLGGLNSDNKQSSSQLWSCGNKAAQADSTNNQKKRNRRRTVQM